MSLILTKIIPVLILILGGFWRESLNLELYLSVFLTFLLIFLLAKGKKLRLPDHFIGYLVFLFIFLISLNWSYDLLLSIRYFLYFYSGGLIWLILDHLKNRYEIKIDIVWLIYFISAFFGVVFIIRSLTGEVGVRSFNLLDYSVNEKSHHHLGDLMAVTATVLIYQMSKSKRFIGYFLPVLIVIAALIYLSYSRSALVSLSVGLGYLILNSDWKDKFTKLSLCLLVALSVVGIVYISSQKGLFSHRQFYMQVGPGLINNIKGVGVGNFSVVSIDSLNHAFGYKGYSGVADNILFEMVAGLGVLSIPFIYWFFSVLKKYFEGSGVDDYNLVFLVLTVNFMFNYIYFIPTFLWLWFISLAFIDNKKVVKTFK